MLIEWHAVGVLPQVVVGTKVPVVSPIVVSSKEHIAGYMTICGASGERYISNK